MEVSNQTLFFLFIGAIVSFYILYLVVKAAVQNGTNDLLQEMKKINGNKEPDNFSSPTISTDPEILKVQKANNQKQIVIMLIVLVVIIIAIAIFS
jgi:hypothetical protein